MSRILRLISKHKKAMALAVIFLLTQFTVAAFATGNILVSMQAILDLPDEKIDLAETKLMIDQNIDPQIDIKKYIASIDQMVFVIKKMLPPNASNIAKVETIKKYLYQSGAWNDHRPYHYDLEDPLGQNLNNAVLSNYMDSRKGNCVSMPILFLILGKRLGLDMSLAMAPKHYFVRYKDNTTGKIFNYETTNGGSINRDVWYIKECGISEVAIQNGIYLKSLTNKETVASMLLLLPAHYVGQKEYLKAMEVCDLALAYFPKNIVAILTKGNTYARILDLELKCLKQIRPKLAREDVRYLKRLQRQNLYWFSKAEALGWEEETPEQDQKYLESIAKEKNQKPLK